MIVALCIVAYFAVGSILVFWLSFLGEIDDSSPEAAAIIAMLVWPVVVILFLAYAATGWVAGLGKKFRALRNQRKAKQKKDLESTFFSGDPP